MTEKLQALLTEGVIGSNTCFRSAFGLKKMVYADWTASARGLGQVEDYISKCVLPFYGNTHTTSSMTGHRTTLLREYARANILRHVNGNSDHVVIFCGSGSTGAINKYVQLIQLTEKCQAFPSSNRPVVFVGPYEHHSNLLPWRETGALVIEIGEDVETGGIDIAQLQLKLEKYKHRSFLVGSFSAGSNVTGVLTDVTAVARTLRQYGALVCFDYAGVGPYVTIDLCPADAPDSHIDAVFISPHKFIGGPGATGLLVARKTALVRSTPTTAGGGTVLFVTDHSHAYLANIEEREEGGTPDIIGCIRAGLVFTIKEQYGILAIKQREQRLMDKVKETLCSHPNVVILGHPVDSSEVHRIPIISFLIRCGKRFLHHNFVSTVLNDLYGIQSRSGCMCAGPYVIRLLGIANNRTNELSESLRQWGYMKPGFTRLSLVYFMEDAECDFILQAIVDLAENAWKLLPQYVFDSSHGTWTHKSSDQHFFLPELDFSLEWPPSPSIHSYLPTVDMNFTSYYADTLSRALDIYASCRTEYLSADSVFARNEDYERVLYPGERSDYSWFVFPKDVFELCHRTAADIGKELTAEDLPYKDKQEFVRPDVYLEHLRCEVKSCDIPDQHASCFRFTNLLGHLRIRHKQFA